LYTLNEYIGMHSEVVFRTVDWPGSDLLFVVWLKFGWSQVKGSIFFDDQ
jgi:hypothetical protein